MKKKMTASLIQAYSNSPRRKKFQIIGSLFLAVVIAAVMMILYLVISARVVSSGRELQQKKDQIDQLIYLSVNYQNEIANLSRFDIMEVKAEELGFRAPYPGEVFYVPVPGFNPEPVTVVDLTDTEGPTVINVNRIEYHESLFDWIGNKVDQFLAPFDGL